MPKNSQFLLDLGQGLSLMMGLPTIASWNNSARPKKPRPGTIGFNIETNSLEFWDGTSWYAAIMSEN